MAKGTSILTGIKDGVSTVEDAKNKFWAHNHTFQDNRVQCVKEIDYYHGAQLDSDLRRQLKRRHQPEVIVNRIRVAVNGIIGVVARAQTDPKADPRTPNDEIDASLATDCLRYAADKNRLDRMKKRFLEDMLVPGTCAAIVEVDKDREIRVRRIRWEEYFIDPRSREEDGSDKTYDGIAKYMYAARAAQKWPEHKEALMAYSGDAIGGVAGGGMIDDAGEDRPNEDIIWYDGKSKRVMIVEMYYKEKGDWYHCVFFGGGMLSEPSLSAYKDEKGRTRNPIECVSAYVDRHNNRYGHVRDMMSIQDEINKRRSKLLHLANSSQIEARDVTAVEVDATTAREEAAKPDGVIPYGWQRVRTTDITASQTALLAESKNEIERFSPNPAVLGRQGSDTSGRALLARQQAGLVELARLLDDFEDFEVRIFRSMWMCMKQFWNEPMWIRVAKDPMAASRFAGMADDYDDKAKFVRINEPITEQYVGVNPETLEPEVQEHVLGYKNQIANLDVDITIDTQAETATIMSEIIDKLMEMVAQNPVYQEEIPFDVFIELLPLPRKHQLLQKIRDHRKKREEAAAKQAEEQKAIAMRREETEVAEIASKAELNTAKAEEIGWKSNVDLTKNVLEYINRNETAAEGASQG